MQMTASPMNLVKNLLAPCLILITLLSSGCSKLNCTSLERFAGSDTDLIAFSYTIADDLTQAAQPPLVPRHPEMPILVTTFVDNNALEKTTAFGRVLQEHISSRLVQLGYTVKEIKLAENLLIEPGSGESILSRELRDISPSVTSQAILVGTISRANRTLYISSRFINPTISTILSSKDYKLCMDDTIIAMLNLRPASTSKEIQEPPRPKLNSILY